MVSGGQPRAGPCRSKPKAKNPRGVRGTESLENTIKKTENYVAVFSGNYNIKGKALA
jgi:hypothetical protein